MKHAAEKMMAVFMADKHRRKRFGALALVLSLLIVTGVFHELMQPVVTMTPDPICGQTEHVHSDACYGSALACGLEEGEEHAHDDSCYRSVLTCGLSEHKHVDACYPASVEEPEVPVNVQTTSTQPSDAADDAGAADVQPGDAADDAGAADVQPSDAADDAGAEDVQPGDAANDAGAEDVQPDDAANDALQIKSLSPAEPFDGLCAGQTFRWNYEISGADSAEYVIADANGTIVANGTVEGRTGVIAWTADRAGSLQLTLSVKNDNETIDASHSFDVKEAAQLGASIAADVRSCFAGDAVSFKIAKIGGGALASCRIVVEQNGEVIAEENAFTETFTVTTASASAASTLCARVEFTDDLGASASAECRIPCAVHKAESRSEWKASAKVTLSDVWTDDLVAVAGTQLGYRESEEDFIIDANGDMQGYTRYGDWNGAAYDDWSAAFVSFCLHYANVPETDFPQNNDCAKWVSRLKNDDLYAPAAQYEPQAGDLIFLDMDNNGDVDHVGIVSKANANTVYAIEGDSEKAVQENSYALSDDRICGYGLLSAAYERHVESTQAEADAPVDTDEATVDSVRGSLKDAATLLAEGLKALAAADHSDSDVQAMAERVEASYEEGDLSDAQYEEMMIALASMLDSKPALMSAAPAADTQIRAATRSNTNGSWGWELSIAFIPVDDNGNVRSDVAAPSATRYHFGYGSWHPDTKVAQNCTAITDVLTTAEVTSIDLISVNTGAKYCDAEYVNINFNSDSCILFCGETSASNYGVQYSDPNYYMAVYYKPAQFTVAFTDGAGKVLAEVTGVRGGNVSVPAIDGYVINSTTNEGRFLTGWQTAVGSTVYGTSIVNVQSDMTLIPVWSEAQREEYTVTFDVGGTQTQVTAYAGQTFAELAAPAAEKDGYRFDGWFTQDGVQYTGAESISAAVTLYAQYTKLITINFVIDNANYTKDPGSGYTHVQVVNTTGLSTNGFTYEELGTKTGYRVYGTGTIFSCTIPTGESLTDNGLKLLSVSAVNQGNNNTYTYISPYSWVDASGKVCSNDTVFNEDTTLRLRLYANNEYYSLNFVCCDRCDRSVTYVLSEKGINYPSPTLAVNSSVAAEYIPSAEDVNAYFTCTNETCAHGAANRKVLSGWYILDQNGNKVAFSEGVQIQSTYLPTEGSSIKVYAEWTDAPQNMSVTFNDVDYTVLSSNTAAQWGATFGSIKPQDPSLTNCTFVGWTMDGGETLMQDGDIITTDATFTAVYDLTITVRIPDFANNNPTGYTSTAYTVRTGAGKTLADATDANGNPITAPLYSNGYLFTGWLVSGDSTPVANLSQYDWLTGERTVTAQYVSAVTIKFCYNVGDGAEDVTVATYYVKSGGTIYDAVNAETGEKYNEMLPTPQVPGHTFNFWSRPGYYDTFTKDATYYANLTRLNKVEFYDGEQLLATAYVSGNAALSTAVDETGAPFVMPAPIKVGYALTGWQDAANNAVTAETIVSGDMKLSAQWTAMIKVHFTHKDPSAETAQTVDTVYYVLAGSALSTAVDETGAPIAETLPEPFAYLGYESLGWYYKAGDTSTAEMATASMIITSETFFTANYRQLSGHTLTIHDMAPDGSEYLGDNVQSIDFLVGTGESARSVLAGHVMHDGVIAADCIWYTVDSNGAKTLFNIDSELTVDTDIFTYTYRMTLTVVESTASRTATASLLDSLFPSALAEVSVVVNGNTITISARQGETFKASDFVVNGVDYTLYTWKNADTGETIDLNALIGYAMTEACNVTATGTAPADARTINVNYYVFLNGNRVAVAENVDTLVVSKQMPNNAPNRYCISAQMLESVYSAYGFSRGDLTDSTRYFPNTDRGSTALYADVLPPEAYYSPIFRTDHPNIENGCDVYYMPKQFDAVQNWNYNNPWNYNTGDESIRTSNCFYTITVLDFDNTPIRTQYGLRSTATTVTLDNGTWKYWTESGSEATATEITENTGSYTISESYMTQPYTFKRTQRANYRVRIVDEYNLVYTADELDAFNQANVYDLAPVSTNVPITLNALAGTSWVVTHTDGTEVAEGECTQTDNGDGTVTLTFAQIATDYTITLTRDPGTYTIEYVTERVNLEKCSASGYTNLYTAGSQSWVNGNGPSTVSGNGTPYSVFPVTEGYRLLAPDTLWYTSRAAYDNKGDVLFTYSFWRWEVTGADGSTHKLDAGDVLSATDLANYDADGDGVITLNARYSVKENDEDSRFATCAFYVNVSSSLADVDGTGTATPPGNYSDALFTTQVYGDHANPDLPLGFSGTGTNTNTQYIYPSTGALTAAQADALIRTLPSGVTQNGFTVYLAEMPSDETILSRLRTWSQRHQGTFPGIKLNDVVVPNDQLTTDNFTIRWYVFKYEDTDAWHVDGLLVPRQGKLTVTKQFDGDAAAIAAVKGNFSIDVTKDDSTTAVQTLNLNLYEKSTANPTGYTAYDAATDTYTWVIDVDQTMRYRVVENNNYAAGTVTTSAEYRIANSAEATQGYETYPTNGVEVMAYAYPTDVPHTNYQTVQLRNTYIPTGTLLLRKTDSKTGHGIAGVNFTLQNAEGQTVNPIYKVGDDYYLYKPENVTYETITTGEITTNNSGTLNLKYQATGTEVTYKLVETAPAGYTGAGEIELMIGADGTVSIPTTNDAATLNDSGSTLTVRNTAQTMSITVEKQWAADETQLPVTVHLYYSKDNGATFTRINTGNAGTDQQLSTGNNWTYTWTAQPMYLDGIQLLYTVRETLIGENTTTGTAYSSEFDDGYEMYDVEINTTYIFADETQSTTSTRTTPDGTTEFATSAQITVQNETYKGEIEFNKVDQSGVSLQGATFTLYSDEDCTATVKSATSGADGRVDFGAYAPGTYYLMKETGTPEGYKDNNTLYRVSVTATGVTMEYKNAENEWVPMPNKRIVNELQPKATITLQKTDNNGNALAGAAFTLQQHNGGAWENVPNAVARPCDQNGTLTFADLLPGSYRLLETTAPAGYYRLTGAIEFTVDENGGVTLAATNSDWSLNGETLTLTVKNHPGSELPHTGGRGTILFTIGGALLMVVSLLCGTDLRRRRGRRCER